MFTTLFDIINHDNMKFWYKLNENRSNDLNKKVVNWIICIKKKILKIRNKKMKEIQYANNYNLCSKVKIGLDSLMNFDKIR